MGNPAEDEPFLNAMKNVFMVPNIGRYALFNGKFLQYTASSTAYISSNSDNLTILDAPHIEEHLKTKLEPNKYYMIGMSFVNSKEDQFRFSGVSMLYLYPTPPNYSNSSIQELSIKISSPRETIKSSTHVAFAVFIMGDDMINKAYEDLQAESKEIRKKYFSKE